MIAVLSATMEEAEHFLRKIHVHKTQTIEGILCMEGVFADTPVVVSITGVGIRKARKTTRAVLRKYSPSAIVSAGYAGALSSKLSVGDIVVGTKVISRKRQDLIELAPLKSKLDALYTTGAMLTENRFIADPSEKARLSVETEALTVDMETWGVAEAAVGTPAVVYAVRVVSDGSQTTLPQMGAFYRSDGTFSLSRWLKYFSSHPSLLLPYFKFIYFDTDKSSKALGEFLSELVLSLSEER